VANNLCNNPPISATTHFVATHSDAVTEEWMSHTVLSDKYQTDHDQKIHDDDDDDDDDNDDILKPEYLCFVDVQSYWVLKIWNSLFNLLKSSGNFTYDQV
jgi:hypothetical protein